MTISLENHKLDSPTGARLHLYIARPKKGPRAVVQINHGMAEHGARYGRFAGALTEAGYTAVVHDHRGHGKTEAPDAALGIFSRKEGWEKVVSDIDAVNRRISDLNPDVPIVCFGHSMGAIAALNYAMRHSERTQGLAAWNSGVETGALLATYRTLLKTERFFKGSDVPSAFARKLTFDAWNKEFAPNRTDFDWLSRDEAEVDKYVADPLCGFEVSIGLWLAVTDGLRYAAEDTNLARLPAALPVHLQAGLHDPCSEHGQAVAKIADRMRDRGMDDITLTLLENTRHESLNELNRDETTAAFIDWLDQRFS